MTEKIFILGSNSFAGRQCVMHFLAQGDRVFGASRSDMPPLYAFEDGSRDQYLGQDFGRRLREYRANNFRRFDINSDLPALTAWIGAIRPNVILDFAGQGMVAESWANPSHWYRTNFLSKVHLHDWLLQVDWLDRYVRASTPEVYGSTQFAVTEDAPHKPSTPYAVSHSAIDMSIMAYHQRYGLPAIITRFANFYGPGQQLYRIVPRAFLYGLLGKKLFLHGAGSAQRAFIYGQDIAFAIERTLTAGRLGATYHFATGELISIAQLVSRICRRLKIDFHELCEVAPDRPSKDLVYEMNCNLAREELKWRPKVDLELGLDFVEVWIRKNLEVLREQPLEYVHKE